jgi:mRNA interferase MazF
MKCGEIWTLRDDGYAAKARPVVIVQSDPGEVFSSVVLCLFTTYKSDNIPTRIWIAPSDENGLLKDSYVMTEKIVTVSKDELGTKIGALQDAQMKSISMGLATVLGIQKEDLA